MVLSSVVISTTGLVIRFIEDTSDWQIVFWRGVSLAVGMLSIVLWRHKRATLTEIRRIGRVGVLGGVFFSGALITYVLAIANTTVANAVFTMSATPFFTAILAWLVLGERIHARTVLAIAVAMAGIALMVSDGLATGAVFGNVMALASAICAASYVVVLRFGKTIDMMPTTALGAVISVIIAGLITGGVVAVPLFDLVLCLILGGVISAVAHALLVISSRQLNSAEMALLILIEFILGPVWVWVIINEVPSNISLIGGIVVLSAVGGHAWASLNKAPFKGQTP